VREDGAGGKSTRRELKELGIMVAIGLPGLGIMMVGGRLFVGGARPLGIALIVVGGLLIGLCGYYYFITDFAGGKVDRRKAALQFIAATAGAGIVGLLASTAFKGLFR